MEALLVLPSRCKGSFKSKMGEAGLPMSQAPAPGGLEHQDVQCVCVRVCIAWVKHVI